MSWADKRLHRRLFGYADMPQKEGAGAISGPRLRPVAVALPVIALLLLVEPVLRAGEIFRPFSEVEIPTPRLGIGGLPFPVRRVPGKVSVALPRSPIVHAHLESPPVQHGGLPAPAPMANAGPRQAVPEP